MAVLLVTANVGSIFEDSRLIPCWVKEFTKAVAAHDAKLVALHMQEVGGKRASSAKVLLDQLLSKIGAQKQMSMYTRIVGYCDTDASDVEKFTALGSVYFVRNDVENVFMFNFDEAHWTKLSDTEVTQERSPLFKKTKFARGDFGVMRSSRKGCLRSAWRVCDQEFELVNVHLFADTDNICAASRYPSEYALQRRAALHSIIDDSAAGPAFPDQGGSAFASRPEKRVKISTHARPASVFYFGDFNFRLALGEVANKSSGGSRPIFSRMHPDHPPIRAVYPKRGTGKPALTLEKKKFLVADSSKFYDPANLSNLHKFDRESDHFEGLHEVSLQFLPTYPYEDEGGPHARCARQFASTRAPGWCDRIMFNAAAQTLIRMPNYFCIGEGVTMGDHKPVALAFQL